MNQLNQFLVGHAEAVLFVAIFAEQIGLPLPAVPILLAAGSLIADGVLNPVAAVGVTVVASVLADLIWFYLGRRGGGRLPRFFCKISSYRGTVLNAFREVEDSLSDLSTLRAQGEAVNRALVSARDTATLASQRYQQGLTSYLDVVDAERAALQAERTEVQLNGQRAVSTILLAKALGGGWERP